MKTVLFFITWLLVLPVTYGNPPSRQDTRCIGQSAPWQEIARRALQDRPGTPREEIDALTQRQSAFEAQLQEADETLARVLAEEGDHPSTYLNFPRDLYEHRRSPPPPATLRSRFTTPERTARAIGMSRVQVRHSGATQFQRLRNRLGGEAPIIVEGEIEGVAFGSTRISRGWFSAQFSETQPGADAETPKVYLTLPLERLGELLPLVVRQARDHSANGMKLGETFENLSRDDRVVVYFERVSDAVAFGRAMNAALVSRGVRGRGPSLTMPFGEAPVSMGVDGVSSAHAVGGAPTPQSWRNIAARRLSDAMTHCRSSASRAPCIRTYLISHGIDPDLWIPTRYRDEVSQLMAQLSD